MQNAEADGTYSERSGSVSSSSPSPASVKAETLVGDNLEDATATESLGVRLALDLEHIEGQQDDFSDTNQAIAKSATEFQKDNLFSEFSYLPAVECMMALPVFLPKAFSKSLP